MVTVSLSAGTVPVEVSIPNGAAKTLKPARVSYTTLIRCGPTVTCPAGVPVAAAIKPIPWPSTDMGSRFVASQIFPS